MKPTTLALALALVAPITAIDLPTLQKTLPACSLGCLAKGAAAHGCRVDDFACQCARLEPMVRAVAPCLVDAGCSLENMTVTARVVLNLCLDVAPEGVNASTAAATARAAAVGAAVVPGAGRIGAVVAAVALVLS